jgi:hypothetical protein
MQLPFHIDLPRAGKRALRPEPERDWLILLCAALLLFSASAVGNALLYRAAVNGAPLGPAAATPALAVPASALAQVENVFAARALEESKYESGAYSFVDPSR